MTKEEWFALYLLRFGDDTIDTADLQEGENEFLQDMGADLGLGPSSAYPTAWTIIQTLNVERKRAWRENHQDPVIQNGRR